MHRGYIKCWRKIKDSFIWQDPEALKLWVHLLMEANYKDTEFMFRGSRQTLKRGQLMRGHRKLADETQISRSKVTRLIKMLKNESLIESADINICSLITIVKYDEYQSTEPLIEQRVDQEWTTSGPGVSQYKYIKALKNDKKVVLIGDSNESPKPPRKSIPPSEAEVNEHCIQQHYSFDPKRFYDHYQANGWKQKGGNPIRDWQAALRNWNRNQLTFNNNGNNHASDAPPIVSPLLAEANRLAREAREARNKLPGRP